MDSDTRNLDELGNALLFIALAISRLASIPCPLRIYLGLFGEGKHLQFIVLMGEYTTMTALLGKARG